MVDTRKKDAKPEVHQGTRAAPEASKQDVQPRNEPAHQPAPEPTAREKAAAAAETLESIKNPTRTATMTDERSPVDHHRNRQ